MGDEATPDTNPDPAPDVYPAVASAPQPLPQEEPAAAQDAEPRILPAAPSVSMPVQYVRSDDDAESPDVAFVTDVHPDGTVNLVSYCRKTHKWKVVDCVPHMSQSNGDTNEHYFEYVPGFGPIAPPPA